MNVTGVETTNGGDVLHHRYFLIIAAIAVLFASLVSSEGGRLPATPPYDPGTAFAGDHQATARRAVYRYGLSDALAVASERHSEDARPDTASSTRTTVKGSLLSGERFALGPDGPLRLRLPRGQQENIAAGYETKGGGTKPGAGPRATALRHARRRQTRDQDRPSYRARFRYGWYWTTDFGSEWTRRPMPLTKRRSPVRSGEIRGL